VKYLSICSGIEAATVAWHPLKWTPLAFSEIEAFPRAVLEHHYPGVPLHGDFTKLRDEPWIVDADILVGGTPCQAFSVAGLRKSLGDDRGNLSLEFINLADSIDAAREAQGRDPGIVVWENVPGVLSVKDNAFGCFLAGLAGEDDPIVPAGKKWTNAGVVLGPKRAVAWRILDAQYFGVAQRRRRVFVVASARDGFDPATVLLEFEGVRRDTPPRREAGQVASTIPSRSTAGGGLGTDFDCDGGVIRAVAMEDPVPPLMARSSRGGAQTLSPGHQTDGHMVAVASTGDISHCLNAGGMGRQDYETETLVTHALRGEGFDGSEDGTGRGTPLVPVAFSAKDHGADATEDLSPTLRAMPHHESHANGGGQMAVAIPFDTTQITSPANYSKPKEGDPCHPLAAGAHPPAIVYSIMPQNSGKDYKAREVEVAQPIMAGGPVGGNQGGDYILQTQAYAFQPRIARNGRGDMGDVVNALNAQSGETGKGDAAPCVAVADTLGVGSNQTSGFESEVVAASMAVRRLTPVECERLQGFPDAYTLIPWKKKPADQCPDGPRYKALGNSMAVPCMRWIGRRIAEALR
jgi:DNA (cytosine-5)-methyltransferase 1